MKAGRIENGYYDPEILNMYTKDEINRILSYIDWNKDFNFTYSGITQMLKKYLIKINGEIIETPQEAFMLIPMYIFGQISRDITIDQMIELFKDIDEIKELLENWKEKGYKNFREALIIEFYNSLSNFEIFLSTPPMVGIRSRLRGYTSCAGVNMGDSVEAFGNAAKSMYKLVTKLRAGLGINEGYIRGAGADINNGMEIHTGIVPYVKVNEAISVSSQQPASGRSGQATHYYPWFHWEIEDILVLKNNRGYDEKRARHNDHAIVFNKFFYKKLLNDEDVALFHINKVDDLYDEIGNEEYFEKKYNELVNDPTVEKRWVSAKRIWDMYWDERFGTARVYKVNAEEFQRHSAFDIPVNMSNLCTEINLPSFPDEDLEFYVDENKVDEFWKWFNKVREEGKWIDIYKIINYKKDEDELDKLYIRYPETAKEFFKYASVKSKEGYTKVTYNFGEIFSCILGGINFGYYGPDKTDDEKLKLMLKNMFLLTWFLDYMIDYQDYAGIETFEKFTKERRSLGISPGNLYYLLAQYDADYNSQLAREIVNELMEIMNYSGIISSVAHAKFRGKCKLFNDTKYSKGIFTFDTYNKNVDELVSNVLNLGEEKWNKLKEIVKKYGMRNSTLFTAVPSSNSSRPGNMISGINPPQGLSYVVKDKKVSVKVLVPEITKYKDFYKRNLAWEHDNIEYWKLISVFQKWIDQAISLNQYVDYTKYEDERIPEEEVLRTDLFTLNYGIKTLYYVKPKTTDEDALNQKSEAKDETEEIGCSSGGCML
jgi:ribonucleoside-diphosphate reductase alpha subunit